MVKRVTRLQAAQAALKDAERELARAEKEHRKAVAKRAKAQERLDKHLAPDAVAKKLRSALRIPRVAVQ